MNLIFKNNGTTTGLSSWLKSFKEIQNSLLIECDLQEQCFISKCFTSDHTVVKYSKISFDDAGLEVLNLKDNNDVAYSLEEWNEKYKVRIKIGIFLILPRFISVVDLFSNTDHKVTVEFDIYRAPVGDEFHAQCIKFKSRSNNMKVKDCNISEFEQVSDDLFFTKINVITEPMSFQLSMDVIKNLTAISSVFVTDSKKDIIKFYTKLDEDTNKWALYAYDETNESYDYMLGFITSGEGMENSVPIYRGNFFTAINTKGGDENIVLTLDSRLKRKLRIESTDGTSYTVLSTVTQ